MEKAHQHSALILPEGTPMSASAAKFATVCALALSGPASVGLASGQGEDITMPSGLAATLGDVVWNERTPDLAYRFRFVAPELRDRVFDPDAMVADMIFLCEQVALPRIANTGPAPEHVIISLADRLVEFGVYDPDVSQFFESFVPQGDRCEWELY